MPSRPPQHRRYIRQVLAGVAGTPTPDRAQIAGAFDTLCDRLRTQLYPLFGITAIDALFARGIHLATSDFTWLAGVVPLATQRCSPDRLMALDPGLTPERIEEGMAAILGSTIELLSAFIGSDLTLPLVQQAWGVAAPADNLQTEH